MRIFNKNVFVVSEMSKELNLSINNGSEQLIILIRT